MDQSATHGNRPMFDENTGSRKVGKAWLIILFVAAIVVTLAILQIAGFSD